MKSLMLKISEGEPSLDVPPIPNVETKPMALIQHFYFISFECLNFADYFADLGHNLFFIYIFKCLNIASKFHLFW